MTTDDFTALLARQGYSYRFDGDTLVIDHSGGVYLRSLTTLPESQPVTFANGGMVDLHNLTALPESYPVTFANGGMVYLSSLTALPERHPVTFGNSGWVFLRNLTTLPESHPVTFANGGSVDLRNLTALPERHPVTFANGGSVDLRNLTALPESQPVTFDNDGWVDLRNLNDGHYAYQGQRRHFRVIDGFTMICDKPRMVGGVSVFPARYFGGGPVNNLPRCYIAEQGDYTAHVATAKAAIGDLRFKIARSNTDKTALVAAIRQRGVITFEEFRLLTGACADGLRRALRQIGFKRIPQRMSLKRALALAHGPYGETFKQLMEKAA